MDLNVVYPNTDGTCKVCIDFFHHNDFTDMNLMEESIAVSHKIQLEDIDCGANDSDFEDSLSQTEKVLSLSLF
jgi:hypothetical protein